MRAGPAAVVDAVLVLAFVLIGRRTHDDPASLAGIARTAWPFAAGLAVGWAVTLLRRRRPAALVTGVTVWVATVAVGMLLRAASGQGTAPSFVVVATVVLGVFLVGWRLLARLVVRPGRAPAGRSG
ncbi:DUF3054 domain-containing protein [Jiangella rhizosphaerae]|uniref:DUF3054 domain-containing protein n=1 Tax=Jiangella rhizosphaerae TaxID=2293569 RepID=A0A418KVX9_9ACTN|nr:DUF3054 domain-containing protein [Jiangella rhizosphaerae]RIQ33637.1 DUF3054 domain-containing protein [Jiangella rhizosphaerae]